MSITHNTKKKLKTAIVSILASVAALGSASLTYAQQPVQQDQPANSVVGCVDERCANDEKMNQAIARLNARLNYDENERKTQQILKEYGESSSFLKKWYSEFYHSLESKRNTSLSDSLWNLRTYNNLNWTLHGSTIIEEGSQEWQDEQRQMGDLLKSSALNSGIHILCQESDIARRINETIRNIEKNMKLNYDFSAGELTLPNPSGILRGGSPEKKSDASAENNGYVSENHAKKRSETNKINAGLELKVSGLNITPLAKIEYKYAGDRDTSAFYQYNLKDNVHNFGVDQQLSKRLGMYGGLALSYDPGSKNQTVFFTIRMPF